jgi:hypothetical protein
LVAASAEAEQIVGATNERLRHCQLPHVVLDDFLALL